VQFVEPRSNFVNQPGSRALQNIDSTKRDRQDRLAVAFQVAEARETREASGDP
jgi:hypothetical protein